MHFAQSENYQPLRVTLLPDLQRIQDRFHLLRGQAAVVTEEPHFEFILFIPPNGFISVEKDDLTAEG